MSLVIAYWMVGAFFMAMKRYAEYRHIGDPRVAAAYRRSFAFYTEERLLVSLFFYATTCALFAGIFIVRYHLELILFTPLGAGLFAYYLHIGTAAEQPGAESGEAVPRSAGSSPTWCVATLVFVAADVHVDSGAVRPLQRRAGQHAAALDAGRRVVPGLVGVRRGRAIRTTAAERFGAALERMRRHPRRVASSRRPAAAWRLADVSLAGTRAARVRPPTGTPRVVFHGVLHNEAALRSALHATAPIDSRDASCGSSTCRHGAGLRRAARGRVLLWRWSTTPRERLRARDGPDRQLPDLLAGRRDGFDRSAPISRPCLRAAPDARRLDLRAVADYLTIGAVLGDKTLAEGVQRARSRDRADLRPAHGAADPLQPYVSVRDVLPTDSGRTRRDIPGGGSGRVHAGRGRAR